MDQSEGVSHLFASLESLPPSPQDATPLHHSSSIESQEPLSSEARPSLTTGAEVVVLCESSTEEEAMATQELLTAARERLEMRDVSPERPSAIIGETATEETFRRRLQTNILFLTYPQCSLSKERVAQELCRKIPDIKWLKVVRESHGQTTGVHLHALLYLGTRLRTRDARFADIDGHHGNYASVRNFTAAIKYLDKEDTAPLILTLGDAPFVTRALEQLSRQVQTTGRTRGAKRKVTADIAQWLREGRPVKSVAKSEDPQVSSWMLMNSRKAVEFARMAAPEETRSLFPKVNFSPTPVVRKIQLWLGTRWSMSGSAPIKSPQLWIQGPPSCGKTTFSEVLIRCLKVYCVIPNDKWYDGFDEDTEMMIFDEFGPEWKLPLFQLNRLIDGSTVPLPQRGVPPFIKKATQNIPCLILSNYSPEECFPNVSEVAMQALLSRLTIVVVPEGEFIKVFE